jgi:hypothetical protein
MTGVEIAATAKQISKAGGQIPLATGVYLNARVRRSSVPVSVQQCRRRHDSILTPSSAAGWRRSSRNLTIAVDLQGHIICKNDKKRKKPWFFIRKQNETR